MYDIPVNVKIIAKHEESADVFTLTLAFTENENIEYDFQPGQFNMLYLFGAGEIPISILAYAEEMICSNGSVTKSPVERRRGYEHTIRRVGRVTEAISLLKVGDTLGLRGPFGRGWPMEKARGKDVLIVTGGVGCAPSMSIVHHVLKNRDEFGKLTILQGVKHSDDLIFRKQYEYWASLPNVEVALAADISKPNWPGHTGLITELLDKVSVDLNKTICMMCGPNAMMLAAAKRLSQLNLSEEAMYLTLERNMECAIGHCGHCQFGGSFICKDGPVFSYPEIKALLNRKGF